MHSSRTEASMSGVCLGSRLMRVALVLAMCVYSGWDAHELTNPLGHCMDQAGTMHRVHCYGVLRCPLPSTVLKTVREDVHKLRMQQNHACTIYTLCQCQRAYVHELTNPPDHCVDQASTMHRVHCYGVLRCPQQLTVVATVREDVHEVPCCSMQSVTYLWLMQRGTWYLVHGPELASASVYCYFPLYACIRVTCVTYDTCQGCYGLGLATALSPHVHGCCILIKQQPTMPCHTLQMQHEPHSL